MVLPQGGSTFVSGGEYSPLRGGWINPWWGDDMASVEHEPIPEVWEQSPQRGPGVEPLVRGSGGEASLNLKEN